MCRNNQFIISNATVKEVLLFCFLTKKKSVSLFKWQDAVEGIYV